MAQLICLSFFDFQKVFRIGQLHVYYFLKRKKRCNVMWLKGFPCFLFGCFWGAKSSFQHVNSLYNMYEFMNLNSKFIVLPSTRFHCEECFTVFVRHFFFMLSWNQISLLSQLQCGKLHCFGEYFSFLLYRSHIIKCWKCSGLNQFSALNHEKPVIRI